VKGVRTLPMHLVLFDIDGTLTQTNAVDDRCFLCALGEALGAADLDADWAKYPDVTDSAISAALFEACRGAPPGDDELAAVRRRFVGLLEAEFARDPGLCREVPGAGAVLAGLARAGYALALATGGWRESAELKLRRAGLWDAGLPLASANDARSREAILASARARAAARWGVGSFESVTAVGDAVWDVRAARKFGCPFVGIAAGERAERLRREGARWVFVDYRDPAAFFAALTDASTAPLDGPAPAPGGG
jgi:phosphoglycolate phosphatase-like HAD superfamily hydrolase